MFTRPAAGTVRCGDAHPQTLARSLGLLRRCARLAARARSRRGTRLARRPKGQGATARPAGPLPAARRMRRSWKTRRAHLARAADPRLGRERLPQRRVPLPGLPLRRPRRQGGHRPDQPDALARRRPLGGDPFSEPDGTYAYPTGPGYDENAANLVELRVKPLPTATAFRITLNTLEDPALVATAIAIGGNEGEPHPFPFGANVSAPAQYFLTVHGETAVLTDAATGAPVAGPGAERQRRPARAARSPSKCPHSEWNPGTSTVRLAAGVGLWNEAAGSYLLPGADRAARRSPAGPGPRRSAAGLLRRRLPLQRAGAAAGHPGPGDDRGDPAWWRESAQAQALAQRRHQRRSTRKSTSPS